MPHQRSHSSLRKHVESSVPSIAGWRSWHRAFANLLLFTLAALGAEWLVHQLEYTIEYGSRFDSVMEATSHRYYMAPLGLGLTAVVITLLALAALLLRATHSERRRLLALLPVRLRRRVPTSSPSLPYRLLARTLPALAVCQMAVYLIQENLESALQGAGWPGLWVLIAPQHATVIPLHLLLAAYGALVLGCLTGWVSGSRRAVRVARVLARIAASARTAPLHVVSHAVHLPNLRLLAGELCLRSPPLSA